MLCNSDETEYEYSGSDDDENHAQNAKVVDLGAGMHHFNLVSLNLGKFPKCFS